MMNANAEVRGFHKKRVRMDDDGRSDILSKAKTNRKRLRRGLIRDGEPAPFGSQTQGSYAMRTMIQDGDGDFDIDDGAYFDKAALVGDRGADRSALDVRKMVCAALQDDFFNDKPEVRTNCVRVYYSGGYHVDVPVYRRTRTKDQWTGVVTETFELAGADWKPSDALNVTKWFKRRNNEACGDSSTNGDRGQFVRVVRLVKAFARSRPHWKGKIASGFALSRLVSDHFIERPKRDDEALRDVLVAIRDRLAWNSAVDHPTLNERIVEAGDAKTEFLRKKIFEKLAHLGVLDDSDCTHQEAMRAWDRFFRSDFFGLQPDPDDEKDLDGKTSGPAVIKSGGHGYA
ncbi:cyclic GMP-AMP synthase DncV-like nucleotidyltransferase [Methylobacterium sp. WL120]|uniref:cyclic GMP-AMP synthase DncV-like nucleotidyltransferase n=1 Tax=Methylobacterium sp. WL120 TaxID=2603887 RepID=UPI0011C8EB45|nr:hypothetical protein [Methylobacterium sp. WL120]TXM70742.1 hypothetical protein FV229_01950 [Methylobacterium sp. WL120]